MSAEDNYNLRPSKRTLRSLKSDVTPIAAVKELVDNVIDNWRRLDNEGTDVTINIEIDFDNETFRISDDSGGLSEENVKLIFALGDTIKEEIDFPIGTYGMGAKKAILRLGSNAEIKSRSNDEDNGYGFKITEEWLQDDSWTVEKLVYDDFPKGTTVIDIDDLNIELADEENDSGELQESSGFKSPGAFIEDLKSELAITYDKFLSEGAGPENSQLTIKVNGEPIDPPNGIEWSYTPYDDFHPRHYQEYEIDPEDLPDRDEPVKVDVIAGLMPEGDTDKSGTDVLIQNRRILTANKGMMGGWGTHLKNHNDNIARTKLQLNIYTENNTEDLPWDTQKGRIELNNNITEESFNFLKRAGKAYAAARYDRFPTPFSEPYDGENEIVNRSGPEKLDYSTNTNVVDKPDSNFSQASQIVKVSKYHKNFRVYAPHLISELYRPAYKEQMDSVEEDLRDESGMSLWEIPESAQDLPERELHLWLDTIKDIAEIHAMEGKQISFEDQNPWWDTYYIKIVDESGATAGEIEADSSIEEVVNTVETRINEGSVPESRIKSEELRAIETSAPEKLGGNDDDSSVDDTEGDDDEATTDNDDVDEKEQTKQETNQESPSSEGSGEDDDTKGENGESDDDNSPTFNGTVGRDAKGNSDERRKIILPVAPSVFVEICEAMGLDSEETTPKEVGETIADQDLDIRPFLAPEPQEE